MGVCVIGRVFGVFVFGVVIGNKVVVCWMRILVVGWRKFWFGGVSVVGVYFWVGKGSGVLGLRDVDLGLGVFFWVCELG